MRAKYIITTVIVMVFASIGAYIIKAQHEQAVYTCSGQMVRDFFLPDGQATLVGLGTVIFGVDKGTVRLTGYIYQHNQIKHRVNRIIEFTTIPENGGGFFKVASDSVSKAVMTIHPIKFWPKRRC